MLYCAIVFTLSMLSFDQLGGKRFMAVLGPSFDDKSLSSTGGEGGWPEI